MIGLETIVSTGRLRVIGIFMAGEVRVPGRYSVSALSTVTQAGAVRCRWRDTIRIIYQSAIAVAAVVVAL